MKIDNNENIDKMSKFMHLRLKIARLARAFKSRSAFAKYCGASITTYRAHELGENELKARDLIRYIDALNISAWWLLTGTGDPLSHMKNPSALESAQFRYYIQIEESTATIKAETEKNFGITLDAVFAKKSKN